jgi:chromosome segregation ATPase
MPNNVHNEALITANRERLEVLELQYARYGSDAPPHIITEISTIVATIRALTTVVDLTPDIDLDQSKEFIDRDKVERRRDASTNEQATLRMIATVQATVAEVSNIRSTVRSEVSDIHDQISEVRADVREQLDATKQRVNEQMASIEASVAMMQTVISADVQNLRAVIYKVVANGLRALIAAMLFIAIVLIVIFRYYGV